MFVVTKRMKTTGSSRTKHIINTSLPIFDKAKSVGIEILNMVYILWYHFEGQEIWNKYYKAYYKNEKRNQIW